MYKKLSLFISSTYVIRKKSENYFAKITKY